MPGQLPTLRLLSYEHSSDIPQKPAVRVSPSPITGGPKGNFNVLLSLGDALAWTGGPGLCSRMTTWASTARAGALLKVTPSPIAMVPGSVRILIGYAEQIDAATTTAKTVSRHLAANGGIANMISGGAGRKRATAKSRYHHVHSRRPAET